MIELTLGLIVLLLMLAVIVLAIVGVIMLVNAREAARWENEEQGEEWFERMLARKRDEDAKL